MTNQPIDIPEEKPKMVVVISFDNPSNNKEIEEVGTIINTIKPIINELPNMTVYAGRGQTASDILHICQLKRKETNLTGYARRELNFCGWPKDEIEGVVRVIQSFADIVDSGGHAGILIPVIESLMRYENLSPLTNRLEEWNEVGTDVWQSSRNPEAFSTDGGATYHLLSEKTQDGEHVIHQSQSYSAKED